MTQKEMTSRGKGAAFLKMNNIRHFDEKSAEKGNDFEQWSHLHLEVSRKGPPKGGGGNKRRDGLGLGLWAVGCWLLARAVGCGLGPVCLYIVVLIYIFL